MMTFSTIHLKTQSKSIEKRNQSYTISYAEKWMKAWTLVLSLFVFFFFLHPHAHAQLSTITLSNNVAANFSGTAPANQMYQITVPAGATNLRFTTTNGSGGDIDIFLKFGSQPSMTVYDQKSNGSTNNEAITIAAPSAGTYYLLVHVDSGTSLNNSIKAAYDASSVATLTNNVAVSFSGTAPASKMYQIAVPAGATNLRFTTTNGSGGDIDIFSKFGSQPSMTVYDQKSNGSTNNEAITIAAPSAGTYYLLVRVDSGTSSNNLVKAAYDSAVAKTADMIVTAVTMNPTNPTVNQAVTFSATIKNQGTAATPAGVANGVRFTVDRTSSTSSQSNTASIPAGGSVTVTASSAWTATSGMHSVDAWVNSGALYPESNTSNNHMVSSFNVATQTTPPPVACTPSTIAPVIGSKAAWDAHFFGSTVPDLSRDGGDLAWTQYYWLRAYVSMALTFGDTKYLDRAVVAINHMLSVENAGGGWGAKPLYDQLGTAQVTQSIMHFVYSVYKDPRFVGYRAKADTYLARVERALKVYDPRWVDHSPVLDASFYIYSSCGGDGASLCGTSSLVMYNQGASMAKAWLLVDRVYRLKGLTPPPAALYKADKAANYFLKFAQNVNGGYLWRYEGGRPGNGWEDTNHGHVDMSLLIAAGKFKIGGLTDSDMLKMAATFKNKILNGQPGPNDVAVEIDGTGLPTSNYDRVTAGYDWIDLADYDPTLLTKVVNVFNRYMTNFNVARGSLGWAEILRKNSCTPLY